ncbi:hypothetical protein STENM223S_06792 [Streptomyces tendae]
MRTPRALLAAAVTAVTAAALGAATVTPAPAAGADAVPPSGTYYVQSAVTGLNAADVSCRTAWVSYCANAMFFSSSRPCSYALSPLATWAQGATRRGVLGQGAVVADGGGDRAAADEAELLSDTG